MEWRPLVGLRDGDRGTLVEQVLSRVVLDEAIDQHNQDVQAAKRA